MSKKFNTGNKFKGSQCTESSVVHRTSDPDVSGHNLIETPEIRTEYTDKFASASKGKLIYLYSLNSFDDGKCELKPGNKITGLAIPSVNCVFCDNDNLSSK
jgi:hypothetical protein